MKYALIIDSNRYEDPKLAQLKKPAADSQALAKVLGDQAIGAFGEVTPLINQSETRVQRAISAFLAGKKPDDLAPGDAFNASRANVRANVRLASRRPILS